MGALNKYIADSGVDKLHQELIRIRASQINGCAYCVNQHGLSDELYDKAITLWGEEKTAQVIMTIITINAWNRIGVGLNMHPEL